MKDTGLFGTVWRYKNNNKDYDDKKEDSKITQHNQIQTMLVVGHLTKS
jgi:hypothetical protein